MISYSSSPIVLFDGMCNLCNGAVRFIMKYERNKELKFSSLQSDTGKRLLKDYSHIIINSDSIVYIYNGKAYTESDAAIKIASYLKYPWSLLNTVRFLPESLTNFIYRIIARNRYRIFGRRDSCMVPDEKELDRFVG